MDSIAQTITLFGHGLNCSQAILTVFGEQFGVDAETAKKMGRPWGGGMGHLAQTCGALTGAIMVLGLASTASDESEARKEAFSSVKKLFRCFEEKFGTTVCKNLLGEDLSTEEGARNIREKNLVPKLCPEYVRAAAEILNEIIASKLKEPDQRPLEKA
ncbi:MAG: C_GCAxxG_C_C family protein [Desulfobacteraceae bacterium]|nr:MAG: C_GCAxxG_C_C family protein [Desulfobacteraceae bacterium]